MTPNSDAYDAKPACGECRGTGWINDTRYAEGGPCCDCNAWGMEIRRMAGESTLPLRRAA